MAAAEKYRLKQFACKRGQSVVKAMQMRVDARFCRNKQGQLKYDWRLLYARSFEERKSVARRLTFPAH